VPPLVATRNKPSRSGLAPRTTRTEVALQMVGPALSIGPPGSDYLFPRGPPVAESFGTTSLRSSSPFPINSC